MYLTVTRAMQEVMSRGTGRSAHALAGHRLPCTWRERPAATDDLRDSWFAGFAGASVSPWSGSDATTIASAGSHRCASGALKVWADIRCSKAFRLRPLSELAAA